MNTNRKTLSALVLSVFLALGGMASAQDILINVDGSAGDKYQYSSGTTSNSGTGKTVSVAAGSSITAGAGTAEYGVSRGGTGTTNQYDTLIIGNQKNLTITGSADKTATLKIYGEAPNPNRIAAEVFIEKGGVLTLAGKGSVDAGTYKTSNSMLVTGAGVFIHNAGTINIGDGVLALAQAVPPAPQSCIINTGLITIGQYADVYKDASLMVLNGVIKNHDTVSNVSGIIEVDGRIVNHHKPAQGSLNEFLGQIEDTGSGKNIGNVIITNTISSLNSVVSLAATGGTLTIADTQNDRGYASGISIDAGVADLVLAGAHNNVSGALTAADITFSGIGGTYTGSVTAAHQIDILSNSTFSNGIAAASGTTIARGAVGTFNGTVASNVLVKSGAIFAVADGMTATFSTETLKTEEGALISFTGTGNIAGNGTVDFDPNSRLLATDAKDGTTLFAAGLDKRIGGSVATDDQVKAYLEKQAVFTFTGSSEYTLEADGSVTVGVRKGDLSNEVLNRQGMSRFARMISGSTLDTQKQYAGMTPAEIAALPDSYIGELMQLASSAQVSGKEAYVLHQHLNGAAWAGAVEAVTDTARNFNRAVLNRAYNTGHLFGSSEYDECGNIVENCSGYANRIWAGYTGQWGDNDGRGWDQGYKYSAHGFNLGYDHVTSSGIAFGAAFGYSTGTYENKAQLWGSDSDVDNYSFGLFASYHHASGWFSMLSGAYTYSRYTMHNGFTNGFTGVTTFDTYGRGRDDAKFHGDTLSLGWKTGFDWNPVRNLTLTPTIGLEYYDSRTNRFDTDIFNGMKYSRRSFEMPVDITAQYDIETGCASTLSLIGTAGYTYNFHHKGTKIREYTDNNGLTYGNHRMPAAGRNAWHVGVGAQYRYRNVDVGVHYEYSGRSKYDSHTLFANVGVSF